MKNSFLNYLLLELLIRILWWIMKYIIVISFFKRVCYNLQEILQIWRNGRRVRLRGVWTLFVGVRVSLSAPYILYFCVKCCEYWNHGILFFCICVYFLLFIIVFIIRCTPVAHFYTLYANKIFNFSSAIFSDVSITWV